MPGEEGIHFGSRLSAGELHEQGTRNGSDYALSAAAAKNTAVDSIAAILQGYADRGVFRGFARGPVRAGIARFKILWHKDRAFDLDFDAAKRTLRFRVVLPEAPADLYREYKSFVDSQSDADRPEHRRIDPKKARASCAHRGGNVSVTMTARDRDYEYAARKLIALVHETYVSFLPDGHFEYMIEAFNLDPDRP